MPVIVVDGDSVRVSRWTPSSGGEADVWPVETFDPATAMRLDAPSCIVLGACEWRDRTLQGTIRLIREAGFTGPVLVLHGNTSPCEALEAGADAVLPSDAAWEDLMAQKDALARREAGMEKGQVAFAGLAFDPSMGSWSVEGSSFCLAKRHSGVLAFLVERRGKWVSARDIGLRVWGERSASHKAHQSICRIRKALEEAGRPGFLASEPGRGYRLSGEGR